MGDGLDPSEKPTMKPTMYGNLVSAIAHFLTPDVIAKMASVAGIADGAAARKVAGAGAPAILSAMAYLASKPVGAQRLADAIAEHSPHALDALALATLASSKSAAVGRSALTALIGSRSAHSLAAALGKFGGVGEGAAEVMLGMLTSAVFAVLGREVDVGATGIVRSFAAQNCQIAAAMPRALSESLHASGFLVRPIAVAPTASQAHDASGEATEVGERMTRAGSTAAVASVHWAYWALPLAVIAGLLWYLFGSDTTAPRRAMAPSSEASAFVDEDFGRRTTAVVDALRASLQRVQNGASPGDELPQLQRVSRELDHLQGTAARLPEEVRSRLANGVAAVRARLKSKRTAADALPGTPTNVAATIAALDAKLDGLLTPGSMGSQISPAAVGPAAYVTAPANDVNSVREYLDQFVYDEAGEKVGLIQDLMLGPDGRIAAAIIGVGGFLGIGEKDVAVTFASLRVVQLADASHLVMNATQEALKEAPTYRGSRSRN
jgi:hypothetical protein